MKNITSNFKNTKGVEVFLHKGCFATIEQANNGRLTTVACVDRELFCNKTEFFEKIQSEINIINKGEF